MSYRKTHEKRMARKQAMMKYGQCLRKIGYVKSSDAHKAKKFLEQNKMETELHVYKCTFCGKYHVGHS